MIKFFLFLLTIFPTRDTRAFNVSDCQKLQKEDWVCDYMDTHGREYNSHSEFLLRKARLSSGSPPHPKHNLQWGLTSKSDRFPHELRSNYAFVVGSHRTRVKNNLHIHKEALGKLPNIDWRKFNRVTSVKDQGDCGGCFAFASASLLEFWSKPRFPKSFSAQNLMDCTSGNHRPNVGCDGGLMEYVFEYTKKHPVSLDSDFPYRYSQKKCPSIRLWSHIRVSDYKVLMIDDNPKAEQQLEYILHKYGPVAVGIDSSSMDNYRGGIFPSEMCSNDIDHAVTIVGYTKNAWIIKNSWGKDWGVQGYLYLERGKNACGVAEYMVYIDKAYHIHKKLTTRWHMDAV